MSHTVLKSYSYNNRGSGHPFDAAIGTLEVYWEQLRSSLSRKARGTPPDGEEAADSVRRHLRADTETDTSDKRFIKTRSIHARRHPDRDSLKLAPDFVRR